MNRGGAAGEARDATSHFISGNATRKAAFLTNERSALRLGPLHAAAKRGALLRSLVIRYRARYSHLI